MWKVTQLFELLTIDQSVNCLEYKLFCFQINLADTFCRDAHTRVKRNILDVEDGPFINNDDNYKKVAKQVFKSGGYFAEHPLARNY
jgi:hypothetical protein